MEGRLPPYSDGGDGYHSASPSLYSTDQSKATFGEAADLDLQSQLIGITGQSSNAVDEERDDRDDRDDDIDSAFDEESLLSNETSSLSSYITNYRYEHGRRYHAYRDGAYWVRFVPARSNTPMELTRNLGTE
jgi:hypothetical protein